MTIVLNGTTGITNDGGYTGDGVVFADTTPANTLVTTTGGNVGIGNTAANVNDQVGAVRPLLVSRSDTSTTIAGSQANIVIGNADTTTSNTSQISFAALTGANSTYFTSAAINCVFGARTNGQYPTGQLTFSTSTSLNSAPTEKMRIDSSGNVGIGTSSPNIGGANTDNAILTLKGKASTRSGIFEMGNFGTTGNDQTLGWNRYFDGSTENASIEVARASSTSTAYIKFSTNGGSGSTERARIDSSGNLLVGTTSNGNSAKFLVVGGSTGGTSLQAGFGGINGTSFQIYHADAGGQSGTATVTGIAKVASSGRSINAAGTINASGADYAEYMTKAGDFTVAKGDVVGIDNNGKLTNVFSDAVSFCVKSTAPSYVGGDTWGAELEGDELEAARQAVDRIAFAGQVPVNVLGATPGQFIIPVDSNGAIIGQAVSNPTFEQYQIAVGKVIAIESDGRARIIVKVA